MDRPDLQFAASVLGRTLSRPTPRSWVMLKRVGRYLLKHPCMKFAYMKTSMEEATELIGYSDSDWAGCRGTRRSTSGGIITVAGGAIKSWSNRLGSVALSSGEAEYYAVVKTTAELIGVKSVAEDLGWPMNVKVYVDSTAAKGITSRVGIGKVRHLEVRYLWLQEAVQQREVQVLKIRGDQNPADVMTKAKAFGDAAELLRNVNVYSHSSWQPRWADVAD
jgi:hypothetical protein